MLNVERLFYPPWKHVMHLNLSKLRCRNLEGLVLMQNRVGGVKRKYLKMLKDARVASGGYTIRTLLSTYFTNKKNYAPQSKVKVENQVWRRDYKLLTVKFDLVYKTKD